jgi:L-fuconate dehydratase
MTEHAAHLHEHFIDPIRIERGRYQVPRLPGISAQMKPESIPQNAWHGTSA